MSNTSTTLGLTSPSILRLLPITGTFTLPFTTYLVLLSSRIVYHRLSNETYLGDKLSSTPSFSSEDPLYISTRAHQNFIENVPFAFLLTAVAELNGGNRRALASALTGLLVCRILHSELGLRRKKALGGGRPIAYYGTQAFLAGMAGYGAWLVKEYWGF